LQLSSLPSQRVFLSLARHTLALEEQLFLSDLFPASWVLEQAPVYFQNLRRFLMPRGFRRCQALRRKHDNSQKALNGKLCSKDRMKIADPRLTIKLESTKPTRISGPKQKFEVS
jgi:hypothetical protein